VDSEAAVIDAGNFLEARLAPLRWCQTITAEMSGFASGGPQVGWNGRASANFLGGFIKNPDTSNANYSGPFTNAAASIGPFGGFVGLSSAGYSNPLKINLKGAAVAGGTFGLSLFSPVSVTASVTYYSKPLALGNVFTTSGPLATFDQLMYVLRRVCQ
jgi:hypothetical protein